MRNRYRNKPRRRRRLEEATAREEARALRSDADQLDRLESRGHGACSEAVILAHILQEKES